MLAAGRAGRREGGGFYDIDAQGRRTPWPGLAALFPPTGEPPPDDEIALRLRLAEAMEALRCLEQGVVRSADDADTASVLGLGFPAAHGGILAWCEGQGLARLVGDADRLAQPHGPRFLPSHWLRERARTPGALAAWRSSPAEERQATA